MERERQREREETNMLDSERDRERLNTSRGGRVCLYAIKRVGRIGREERQTQTRQPVLMR